MGGDLVRYVRNMVADMSWMGCVSSHITTLGGRRAMTRGAISGSPYTTCANVYVHMHLLWRACYAISCTDAVHSMCWFPTFHSCTRRQKRMYLPGKSHCYAHRSVSMCVCVQTSARTRVLEMLHQSQSHMHAQIHTFAGTNLYSLHEASVAQSRFSLIWF